MAFLAVLGAVWYVLVMAGNTGAAGRFLGFLKEGFGLLYDTAYAVYETQIKPLLTEDKESRS